MFKIDINKQLDYEVYADFCDFSVAGANFAELIRKDHPEINLNNYKKYIDNFYFVQKLQMVKRHNEIKIELAKKQDRFFAELNKLFNMDFSKDTYQGYLSIFNCNPRWPEEKTFQVYWKKDTLHAIEVIFHESLHFAFFEYLEKNFADKINGLDKNSGVLWELSEIFNIIILNLPQFKDIIEVEEKLFYPQLQNKLNTANEFFKKSKDINQFITRYLNQTIL